jgi:hypothetical protein
VCVSLSNPKPETLNPVGAIVGIVRSVKDITDCFDTFPAVDIVAFHLVAVIAALVLSQHVNSGVRYLPPEFRVAISKGFSVLSGACIARVYHALALVNPKP